MAIISNIEDVFQFLPQNDTFVKIKKYLLNSLNQKTKEYKRIHNLPIGSFERFDLFDDVFAVEQTFKTKNRNDCFFESHKYHVDIQMIISGTEQMELTNISNLIEKESYNKETDFIIYNITDISSKIVLQNRNIAVFYPNDAHMGIAKYKEENLIYKTVVKVPLKYFEKE
jgi:YhcH/YjgK/YiaL family protein